MSTPFEVTVHIRRGFPLLVKGEVYPAEPDVGLPRSYFGEIDILTRDGKSAAFLKLTPQEVDHIEEEVWYELEKQREPSWA